MEEGASMANLKGSIALVSTILIAILPLFLLAFELGVRPLPLDTPAFSVLTFLYWPLLAVLAMGLCLKLSGLID